MRCRLKIGISSVPKIILSKECAPTWRAMNYDKANKEKLIRHYIANRSDDHVLYCDGAPLFLTYIHNKNYRDLYPDVIANWQSVVAYHEHMKTLYESDIYNNIIH